MMARAQDGRLCTDEDFEQLPPALQRKYFSSLERLRLAHDGTTTTSTALSRSQSRRPSTSRSRYPRSHSLSTIAEPSRVFQPARKRLRKTHRPSSSQHSVQTAQEFASLPPKLQRKLFSCEEQYQLASRCSPVILDAADEVIVRSRQRNSNQHLELDELIIEPNDRTDTDPDMDISDVESLKWLEADQELDLTLDDYHAILVENASKYEASLPRRSCTRGTSMSNASIRRRSSSSTSPRSFPLTHTSSIMHHKSRDSISTTALPTRTHYQDPEARMKLRVYLASPQKFDEALEFGFPALDAAYAPVTRPHTSSGSGDSSTKAPVADDTPSLTDDDTDERSDHMTQHSPRTPLETTFLSRGVSQKSNGDRFYLRPRMVKGYTDPYTHATPADREMTLHLTLTRPDLRTHDGPGFSVTRHINDIPLERAPLDDPNAIKSVWDELPEERSKVKRFFQKWKMRS